MTRKHNKQKGVNKQNNVYLDASKPINKRRSFNMKKVFKWGILGPGYIANQFIKGLKALENAEVVAVGSRSIERANAFAKEYNIPKRYGNYIELAEDPDIDIIYIATPHPFHCEHSILCLEAGKAVLCEKPLTINEQQSREVTEFSRKKKVFLMEAMWTRFLPVFTKVREWLSKEVIGEVHMLKADFGYREMWDSKDRHANLKLCGGALLDVGIYPIAFASLVFKSLPSKIESIPYIGTTGVDERSSVLLGYNKGQIAVLSSAMSTSMPHDAWIFGTQGNIYIPNFWRATSAILKRADNKEEIVEMPFKANGYEYEAYEVMKCIEEGKLESELMPLDESLEIIKIIDRIREQWGLKYPGEKV